MVRNYKCKKDPGYSEGSLDKAIQKVKDGKSINKAAKDNNIPCSTLHTWIKRLPSKEPVKLIKQVKIAHSFLQSVSDQFHVIILSLPM